MSFINRRTLPIFFLVLALIIALINPFLITSPNIDDLNPFSYIIVPIVMLPLLAAFAYKKKMQINVETKDIGIGIGVFLLFIALLFGTFTFLNAQFVSYRLDMLLFPVLVVSFLIILFGVRNAWKFKPIMAYPLLASPLILFFVGSINAPFAQANTIFVYQILHMFSNAVQYLPPFSISTSSYTIGIGTSCAGIAIFIALVAFLLPIAYLFNGKTKDKALWVISGFVLLVILNFLRMGLIAASWLLYGPSISVSIVHSFAGIILFYISIIAMMLLAGRYKLTYPKEEVQRESSKIKIRREHVIVLIVALACFFLSSAIYF